MNRKKTLLCLLMISAAGAVLLWATTSPPGGSIIEFHEEGTSSSYIGNHQGYLLKQAQQFYLDEDAIQPVSGIGILLRESNYGEPSGDITLALYDNASGNVPGNIIEGSEASFTPVPGQWNYITYTDVDIVLGTGSENKYWIAAAVPEQSAENSAYCWLRSNAASTYPKGYRKTFNSGGTGEWSGSQTGRLTFRIYGEDANVNVSGASLSASQNDKGVMLQWNTYTETQTAGFNVYRSDVSAGNFSALNTEMIPAKGSGSAGAAYSFTDKNALSGTPYYYKIEELLNTGKSIFSDPVKIQTSSVMLPFSSGFSKNFPNPFNPGTTIPFTISGASLQQVKVELYNTLGQKVASLVNGSLTNGKYEVQWNGMTSADNDAPSGYYIARLTINNQVKDSLRICKIK